jgi:hypothetical protein
MENTEPNTENAKRQMGTAPSGRFAVSGFPFPVLHFFCVLFRLSR